MTPLRFVDRLKFFLERQLIKGAFFQPMVVALLISLISLIGGLLRTPPDPQSRSRVQPRLVPGGRVVVLGHEPPSALNGPRAAS